MEYTNQGNREASIVISGAMRKNNLPGTLERLNDRRDFTIHSSRLHKAYIQQCAAYGRQAIATHIQRIGRRPIAESPLIIALHIILAIVGVHAE